MGTVCRKLCVLSIKHHIFILLLVCLAQLRVQALPLEQLPISTTTTTTPVSHVHQQFADLPEGKHTSQRASINIVVDEVKEASPRLAFFRAHDASLMGSGDDDSNGDNNHVIELLLRERDSFLTRSEIEEICKAASQPGATLQCCGYPEKLSLFDGPSFFPHIQPTVSSGVCLHVVAANVTLATGELLTICPTERTPRPMMLPGQMPPLTATLRTNKSRGGSRNRNRGSIFAAWALDTFGADVVQSGILDVAGGSGQLAFQLGVRRGFNTTVVDPRPLRLASDQQRTLQYHRETGMRVIPEGRDPSKAASDYGHHFYEVPLSETTTGHDNEDETVVDTNSQESESDRQWLVGGEAHVRHLATWFDPAFVSTDVWRDASVVLGMHPDEATEDIVDLCLAHDKPFAVVPCCVFWKRDPQRRTPSNRPVRTWEQFCEYLAAKDEERIHIATLPFVGRNTVLYSLGGRAK